MTTLTAPPIATKTEGWMLPLVVGVTGHRDVRDEDRGPLKERVQALFADLRQRYPHSPLTLLTALAEGADRLAAEAAIAEGVNVIAALPLAKQTYMSDFPTAASQAEFEDLLGRADTWFERPPMEGVDAEALYENGPLRDHQYAEVGAYVVRHCHILLALWDGNQAELVGGTSQIVRFQLEGIPEPYAPHSSSLDEPETGPVFHIVTPRASNPHTAYAPYSLRMLFPEEFGEEAEAVGEHGHDHHAPMLATIDMTNLLSTEAGQSFHRRLMRTDIYNRDARRLAAENTEAIARSQGYLLGKTDPATLPPRLLPMLQAFATADALAIGLKVRTFSVLRGLLIMTFLAIVSTNIFAYLIVNPLFLVAYLGILGAAYIWFTWAGDMSTPPGWAYFLLGREGAWKFLARRGDFKTRFLDYRALAEGMRVQFFWHLAGLPESVGDHYLRKQRTELDWIRDAVRVWDLPVSMASSNAADAATGGPQYHELVAQLWVDDQRRFYTRATERDREAVEVKERWVSNLFLGGLLIVTLLIVFAEQFHHLPHDVEVNHWPDWIAKSEMFLHMLSVLALAAAALREGYAEKGAISEQLKQYQRMAVLFLRASNKLRELLNHGDTVESQRLIRELGDELLAENGDWVLVHRGRPVSAPKG